MRSGTHLRELWGHKLGVAISAAVALLVALSTVFTISLLPPGLQPRSVEIGTAATHVLVDTPKSKIVDLNANTNDFMSLTTRADLLGNVMAGLPVRTIIARSVGVDPRRIQVTAPITASVPRSLVEPGSGESASDVVASPDRYKLQIQADPAVPILNVYAQAPSAGSAERLANASIDGLRSYLAAVAQRQGIPASQQVQLQQFGRAQGGVANGGFALQFGVLTFVVVFTLGCVAVLVVDSIRRGWVAAGTSSARAVQ